MKTGLLTGFFALALATAAHAQAPGSGSVGDPAPPPDAKADGEVEAAPGYMNAFVCEKISDPLTVEVELLDNSDENLRLHGVFVDALSRRGIQMLKGAQLILSLDIEHIREGRKWKPADLVDVRVGNRTVDGAGNSSSTSSATTDNDAYARVHMNIWSNRRDSVIGGRRDTVEQEAVDQLHVVLNINSREDGRCLWRGEAIHDMDVGDPRRIGPALMRYLAGNVGKAASRTPIRLNF